MTFIPNIIDDNIPSGKSYTLIFLFSENLKEVYLVYKMKGPCPYTFNGIGGKVEPGECYRNGALRECKEEVGLDLSDRLNFIDIDKLPESNLVIYATIVKNDEPSPQEDESMCWHHIKEIECMLPEKVADGLIRYVNKALCWLILYKEK